MKLVRETPYGIGNKQLIFYIKPNLHVTSSVYLAWHSTSSIPFAWLQGHDIDHMTHTGGVVNKFPD
jgi:hypothetical protein